MPTQALLFLSRPLANTTLAAWLDSVQTHLAPLQLQELFIATTDSSLYRALKPLQEEQLFFLPPGASLFDALCHLPRIEQESTLLCFQDVDPTCIAQNDVQKLLITVCDPTLGSRAALLYAPLTQAQALDPTQSKVLLTQQNKVLFISRLCPDLTAPAFAPLGVFAYASSLLSTLAQLPPSPLAQESEQLRLLQADIPIIAVEATESSALCRANSLCPTPDLKTLFKNIKMIITDVDGVLTDGSMIYSAMGEELKRFNAKDGYGIMLARKAGLIIAILTGRDCPALQKRIADLKISLVQTSTIDKVTACPGLIAKAGLTPAEVVFLGDDLIDAAAFSQCAFGIAVADAMPEVKAKATYITNAKGGHGALREVIDLVLQAWEKDN